MDRKKAYELVEKDPNVPVLDTALLEATPDETVTQLFKDPEVYFNAVKQSNPNLFPEEETGNLPEIDGGDSVAGDQLETPPDDNGSPDLPVVAGSVTTESDNPFESWGISKSDYDNFVKDGVIRDGKFQGKYSPDELSSYITQSINESKLRGLLANEVGDARQVIEERDRTLRETKEYHERLLESDLTQKELKKVEASASALLNASDIDFEAETLRLSNGEVLEGDPLDHLKNVVLQKASQDKDIQRAFKRAGKKKVPTTQDEWDEIALERADLMEDFAQVRDAIFEDEVRKLVVDYSFMSNRDKIFQSAIFDSAQVLHRTLKDEGILVPDTDPRVEDFVKRGIAFLKSEFEKDFPGSIESPDSRYFYRHPETKRYIPRADALDTYLRLQNRDLLKDMSTWPMEPVQETPSVDYQGIYDNMVSKLQQAFDAEGLEITQDDPLISEGVSYIVSNKDNPLYWENGQPRADALVVYQRMVKPSLISDIKEDYRKQRFQQEAETRVNALKTEWEQRLRQMGDTTPTISSSISQSSPGQTVPIVSPETYRDPMQMIKLAKRHGLTPPEFYDMQKQRIEALPTEKQRLYF